MKDSGIEWLGEVPAHWQITRLKHISSTYCDGPFGSSLKSDHYVETGVRVVRLQNIKSSEFNDGDAAYIDNKYFEISLKGHEVVEGDVLIAGLGDEKNLVGRSCVAPSGIGPAIVKADCFRFRLRSGNLSSFVSAQLTAGAAYAAGLLSSGSTRSRIPAGTMAQRIIVTPSYEEQTNISAWIVKTTSRFNELLSEATVAIDLLQERRAALISAAVTGKIDVCGAAKVLPFTINRASARGLIAAEIIERSAHQATFGRVKLQKIAFLAEAHVGVTELEGAYLREAAGPFDRDMIREMEREAGALAGVRIEQPDGAGSTVTYRPGDHRGVHRQDLAALLGDRAAKFDKLVADIGTIETRGAEAVATLYAVWNETLIDGKTPADMEIKLAVLSDWHPEKAKKFTINELQIWLDWMRRHGLVPIGSGPKTDTGRLFA